MNGSRLGYSDNPSGSQRNTATEQEFLDQRVDSQLIYSANINVQGFTICYDMQLVCIGSSVFVFCFNGSSSIVEHRLTTKNVSQNVIKASIGHQKQFEKFPLRQEQC